MNIFFIIGAQRAGTTYLYKILDDHPEIYMAKPLKPEPKFFLSQRYRSNLDNYEAYYFGKAPAGTKAFGEKSTSYCENTIVSTRIKAAYPASKIILILRNPIDRAISNYYFSLKNGLETRTPEEVFLAEKPPPAYPKEMSADPFDYLGRGEYLAILENYLKHFNRGQIKVLIFEHLVNDYERIRQLYNFIGVGETFLSKYANRKINALKYPPLSKKSQIYLKLKNHFSPQIEKLEAALLCDLDIWRIS